MPSEKALQRAAQAWTAAGISHLDMDADLATAFAEILDEEWAKLDKVVTLSLQMLGLRTELMDSIEQEALAGHARTVQKWAGRQTDAP